MRAKWKDQSLLRDLDSDTLCSRVFCFSESATEQLGEAERAWLKGIC